MTKAEVMAELEHMGSEGIKKIWKSHGAREPMFGVKIGDMKSIVKKVKKDYQLAKDLFATGNTDAMYLAGLIADEKKMTRQDLETWADGAYWSMLSDYTVPWVAAESNYGRELALQWMDAPDEQHQVAGWSTYAGLLALTPDGQLDLSEVEHLLERIEKTIHGSANYTRYAMNNFVLAVGIYVLPLHQRALTAGQKIGKVDVYMGGTACQVPSAPQYIAKAVAKGKIGKKKKTVRC
jgi:3-methyladenine DNA glycosylase AlkD